MWSDTGAQAPLVLLLLLVFCLLLVFHLLLFLFMIEIVFITSDIILGGNCSNNAECADPNAVCSPDDICVCFTGTYDNNTEALLGGECIPRNDIFFSASLKHWHIL